MCSELTPRAPVPDNRIPQLMQPCIYSNISTLDLSVSSTETVHAPFWFQSVFFKVLTQKSLGEQKRMIFSIINPNSPKNQIGESTYFDENNIADIYWVYQGECHNLSG